MECTECGASGYGLHHSAACKYLNIDIYKKVKQQVMRIQELEALLRDIKREPLNAMRIARVLKGR